MIKQITFILFVVLFFNSCKTEAQSDERKKLIHSFVSAVVKYDTIDLYKVVDTNLYFTIQDREGFLSTINYLNKRFKECGTNIVDSSIKIKDMPVHTKRYTVSFCRAKSTTMVYESFDLSFTFTEYGYGEKIRYFEVTKHRKNMTPTIAPPAQQ